MTKSLSATAPHPAACNSALDDIPALVSGAVRAFFGWLLQPSPVCGHLGARLSYDVGLSDLNPDCMPQATSEFAQHSQKADITLLRSI